MKRERSESKGSESCRTSFATKAPLQNQLRPNDASRVGRTVVSLFSGVGGIELGLSESGFHPLLFCEALPEARRVLNTRFPGVAIHEDVRKLAKSKPRSPLKVDVLTAGFPCQDLSQCGRTGGIFGRSSGLVDCVFEMLSAGIIDPRWLMIENVPFMLRLDHGKAMWHVTRSLHKLGFNWAYRVVDARCFGIPQRRERVILLASKDYNPADVLFGESYTPVLPDVKQDHRPRGFYWTEGNSGLGWAIDSVPTLKAGSTIGIPSPPAIWLPAFDAVVTPTIEDVEAFQGLPRGWTSPASSGGKTSARSRWRLVGNAVPVPIAGWVGRELTHPPKTIAGETTILLDRDSWPVAAFNIAGKRMAVEVSTWPARAPWHGLAARFGTKGEQLLSRPRLSTRATMGFYGRIKESTLRTDPRFIPALARILQEQPVHVVR